jgi:hypothetical protein
VAFSYWYVENARQDRLFENSAEQSSYCRSFTANAALDAARSTYYKAKKPTKAIVTDKKKTKVAAAEKKKT